jgi:hypothetical protein
LQRIPALSQVCDARAPGGRINMTSQIFSRLLLLKHDEMARQYPAMRSLILRMLRAPLCAALLLLAACTGSAVVTMTANPSSDPFITYRVGLVSVQLKTSSGKPGLNLLPAEATVDFTKLLDLSEVFGAPSVAKGTYTSAVITLDYSTAQILYDDGSLDGIALTPMASDGKLLGQAVVTVSLDPSDPIRSVAKQVGRLSLNFDLAASNVVDLSANTVTVTPMITASIEPIDSKTIRIRGPLVGANSNFMTTGLMPFESTTAALGQLSIAPSDSTTYEINGFVSAGATGQAEVAALPANTLVTTFGTLSATNTAATADPTTTATPGATTSSVTFTASQVFVDSVAQGAGLSRVSGVVTARSGNTIGIEDATLLQNGGSETLVFGTTIVAVGPNTSVTFFGQGTAQAISPQQISVGSVIEAFGTASNTSNGQVLLDASAGRVRLNLTSASGLVAAQSGSALTLNLTSLGGRVVNSFDFTGSGAAPGQYGVTTGSLDLSNAIDGSPVIVTGFPNEFAAASPNFTASALLDTTTIAAELVIDWSAGSAAPFTTFDSSGIELNVGNSGIGPRHQIQVGSEIVNLIGLSSDPMITPNATNSTVVFSIGHMSSSTVESFNSYTAFITQLQSELNGITLATRMTAVGQYTSSTFAFSASSITLFLNN